MKQLRLTLRRKTSNNKSFRHSITKAFTLAEVLITLAIIGVVASMTIPSLMNNINKQDTVAKVKKAYSVLSQATLAINADCGGNIKGCLSDPSAANDDPTSRQEVAALYKAKLQVNKDCTDTGTGCFANTTYKYLNNTNYTNFETIDWYAKAKLLLTDGSAVCFDWDGAAGGAANLFYIAVDVNGPQPPHQFGKDVFRFYYDSNSGVIKPDNTNDCTTSGKGAGCAQKIIQEGVINYY